MKEFFERVAHALREGTLMRITVGKPTSRAGKQRIVITPATIRGKTRYLVVTKATQGERTDHVSGDGVLPLLAEHLPTHFLSAVLFTTQGDHHLSFSRDGRPALQRSQRASLQPVASQPHNRKKNYLIPESAPFLYPLGISAANGEVRRDAHDKYRQINRYVETMLSLISSSPLAKRESLQVVDIGSGKHYLTFALYEALASHHAHITGVERRADLVSRGSELAEALGLSGLSFIEGDAAALSPISTDIVVALHACDTATDDAIAYGIRSGATIIAVAPCCQKYVRPRMRIPNDLQPLFRGGIVEERLAEILTNSLRALVLEACGYETNVFEFIAGEHTAKNVMISAVQRNRSGEKARHALIELQQRFSLSDFYLDLVLEDRLTRRA